MLRWFGFIIVVSALGACAAGPRPEATLSPVSTARPTDRPHPTAPAPTATRHLTQPATATREVSVTLAVGFSPRVDHTSVDLFSRIPESYLAAAADLSMTFIDRSVGANIDQGLDCLMAPSDEQSRNACRRIAHTDPAFNVDPSEVDWSRPGGYDRSSWTFLPWGEGMGCGQWRSEIDCFLRMAEPLIDQVDVLSFQFSYLEVGPGSDIASPAGFFTGDPSRPDVTDLEAFESAHPEKVFLYWTTSLARGIGTVEAEAFNDQMRAYAAQHGKPLFDVADILSHDPQGNLCFDNRDGVAYRDENHPDDGANLPAICPHYTTETEGGHLGSVSAGKIRLAKAFWVLMAQIAGWKP
jgi:hypothetical protein